MSWRPCEVCGTAMPRLVLVSSRLDGPLVRCRECGLHYVGARARDFTFAAADPGRTAALGDRLDALGIVDRDVERAEAPRRAGAERARAERLTRFAAGGRLLDIGCALGSFLAAATEAGFAAEGVEPDPGTSEQARNAGLRVRTGTLESVAAEGTGPYDVLTMFHVIEHLDSPRAALTAARTLLRPGGLLVIETPTVDNVWFRVAPARWRQLIPDHYFFFSRPTLERLLRETGFEPVDHVTVGRRVSIRFAADRLRRAGVPGWALLGAALERAHLGDRTVHLNPGDIMQVAARAHAP